jgi:hypothetical protein
MTAVDTDVLAPFEIWEVPFGEQTIKFFEPLVLTPSIMPHDEEEPGDEEYLDVINDELNIDVFAKDRDELLAWIHSEICFVWKYIVLQLAICIATCRVFLNAFFTEEHEVLYIALEGKYQRPSTDGVSATVDRFLLKFVIYR